MAQYLGNSTDFTSQTYYGVNPNAEQTVFYGYDTKSQPDYSKMSYTDRAKTYTELLKAQQKLNPGVSSGSSDQWSAAWKAMQIEQMKKNLPIEDISDPTPLLIDKISSLPADSMRRRSAENIKNTIDGTAINIGDGMDNLTRESYKEIKRLTRQSNMLQTEILYGGRRPSSSKRLGIPSVKQLLGAALGNTSPALADVLGIEEGTYTSNLQNWRPYFANAVRPVSDALGSHADTDYAVNVNAAGSNTIFPSSIASKLDKISTFLVDQTEAVFKSRQIEMLKNLPSKVAGSVRQLTTALDEILAVPFEIMSDVYNGIMQLINEISNLLDVVLNFVINFAISILGGLVDAIFPLDQLESLLEPIFELASELGDILDLFSGIPAIGKISAVLSIVSGGFSSILTNLPTLYTLFKTRTVVDTIVKKYDCVTEIFELYRTKLPRIPKALKVLSALGGVITDYGSLGGGVAAFGQNLARGVSAGIGNFGAMLMGGISSTLGSAILGVRDFRGLLAELLPAALGRVMHWLLGKLCKLGMVGDLGFSVGGAFDFLTDSSFSKAMSIYATHHLIVAPSFNKEVIPRGAYIYESALTRYEDSIFVRGAQSHKGIVMIGPGGSIPYRPFGLVQGQYYIGRPPSNGISSAMDKLFNKVNSILR